MESFQFTPDGFRMIVGMCMTGEVGEHFTDLGEGSLLELADRVSKRCVALCEQRDVEMSDEIYAEVVTELAPHFAHPG